MDNYDDLTLNAYISNNKQKLFNTLAGIELTNDLAQNECDKLLQLMEYSPRNRTKIDETPITLKGEIFNIPKEEKDEETTVDLEGNRECTQRDKGLKESEEIARKILSELIEKACKGEQNSSESENEEDEEDEEDDEEYEKLMRQRMKQVEEREKNMRSQINDDDSSDEMTTSKKQGKSRSIITNKPVGGKKDGKGNRVNSTISKISNCINEMMLVRIYLLNTEQHFDMPINISSTIKLIKELVIQKIMDKRNFNLKHINSNAYEMRIIDDDDDIYPNMDMPPYNDNKTLGDIKPTAMAFIEKKDYDPNVSKMSVDLHSTIKLKDDEICIKVYYNFVGVDSVKALPMNPNDTLKTILTHFFTSDIVKYKNPDLYFFVEHGAAQERDNAIPLETNIRYLETRELELCLRKFADIPASLGLIRGSRPATTTVTNDSNEGEEREGKEYFFNEISAGIYQEFEVVKINRYKNKQERILGIDMYNLYNNKPRNSSNKGIFDKIFKDAKNPLKKIKDIKDVQKFGDKAFYIDFKEGDGHDGKRTIYEVKNNNIRNEIVSKLSFLIKRNNQNVGK